MPNPAGQKRPQPEVPGGPGLAFPVRAGAAVGGVNGAREPEAPARASAPERHRVAGAVAVAVARARVRG